MHFKPPFDLLGPNSLLRSAAPQRSIPLTMSNYPEDFDRLKDFVYGTSEPMDDDSTAIGSWEHNDLNFFSNFVDEQLASQVVTTGEELGVPPQANHIQPSATENPYQTGDQSTDQNPYRTEYLFERTRPLPEPMGHYAHNSLPEREASATSRVLIVFIYHKYANMRSAMIVSRRLSDITGSMPKREASATGRVLIVVFSIIRLLTYCVMIVSHRLSDITEEDDKTAQSFATKRKRSEEVERTDPEGNRPKYARKINNENAKYRIELMLSRPEPSRPQGVERLFRDLKSDIIPKKAYYRKKGTNATASHQPVAPSDSTVLPGTGGEDSSSTSNRRSRQSNPRRQIPVETVRQTAPEGWDRFDNEYYSGDDNVSDGEIEQRGKASDWKPPRMACRRCNKLKQPCDHAYPACSLCAKYGLRCRYRDDLTGRQIKPGQLEEVEVALHDAQNKIKRLQEKLNKLEGKSPRDDAQY